MKTPDIIYLSPYKEGEGQDYIGLAWTHPSKFCNHVPYVRRDLIEGMIRDMKERIEQKPAEWSEEDEEVMEDLYNFVISDFIQDHIHETRWKPWKITLERNRQNRLKSLPERFVIQPKQEWSEEDENALTYLHELIGFGYSEKFMDAQTSADMREWVNKSLRHSWKPTEEQMKALLGAEGISRASGYPDNAKVLASLYEDLKKL